LITEVIIKRRHDSAPSRSIGSTTTSAVNTAQTTPPIQRKPRACLRWCSPRNT